MKKVYILMEYCEGDSHIHSVYGVWKKEVCEQMKRDCERDAIKYGSDDTYEIVVKEVR